MTELTELTESEDQNEEQSPKELSSREMIRSWSTTPTLSDIIEETIVNGETVPAENALISGLARDLYSPDRGLNTPELLNDEELPEWEILSEELNNEYDSEWNIIKKVRPVEEEERAADSPTPSTSSTASTVSVDPDGINFTIPAVEERNKLMPLLDKLLLRKRALIESINDQLKNFSPIIHLS